MAEFTAKAKVMCTGCPGMPSELNTKSARHIKVKGDVIGVEDDKDIRSFGTCIVIPTAPKPCKPSLTKWSHLDESVKFNRKSSLKFPNMISCTNGGMITMTFSGQRVSRNGATAIDEKDKDCGWKTCNKKHTQKVTYEMEDIGELNRTTNFPGGWPHPNGCGYNVNKKNNTDLPGAYAIQRHHVLPCDSFTTCDDLKHNLKLMGWNINNGLPNGICLPEDKDDIFWHNLQFHLGSHPTYNNAVTEELTELQGDCKGYCDSGDPNISQELLLEDIDRLAAKFRNKILNWQKPLIDGNSLHLRLSAFQRANITYNIPHSNEGRKYLSI